MADDETVYEPRPHPEADPEAEADPEGRDEEGRGGTAPPPGGSADAPAASDDATRVMESAPEDGPGDDAAPASATRVMAAGDPQDAAPGAAADAGRTRVLSADERAAHAEEPPDATVYGEDPAPEEPAPVPEEPASQALARGTVLFGEYEIVDVLGAGGMGEVYRARHRRLHETRAIKVMHANMARDPTAAEFFDREAKALLSVRHDAVVHCHDLLSDDEGRVYLVMEMIDGISLADRVRTGGPLAEEEVRTLARRVGAGLAAAHARGVIHRDLSPDNIILPGGRPEEAKLIDFGIAKVLATGQETILEGFKGKLAFASPEQLGFFGGRIDGRSDIYSLGLVLYAAATGAAIAMGNSVVEAVDARRQLAGVPADCPESLRADIDALLALHPEDRPASLEGLFGETAVAEPPPRGGAARALPWAGGALLAGLAALAVIELRPAPELDAEPVALEPVATVQEQAPEPPAAPAAEPEPEPPAAKPAPPRRNRTADAKTRLRLLGLLRGAQSALDRGALMSPPGENAYDKYREVLAIDPDNREAREGIRAVAGRYIALARDALGRGELDEADDLLAKARTAAPHHPDLAAVTAALSERRAGG